MLHRVLVADDSEPVQKAIQIALEPYNVEIFEASSYVEALNICKKKSPNLIIADASLTGTDAPKEFKIMSNTAGEVPVLLLEGSFEPIDKEGFAAIGLQSFLKKPFNIEEIEDVIKGQMQINLPVKKHNKEQTQKVEDVPPPPPPPSRPPSSSWENQLVESDLQLDLGDGPDFLEDDSQAEAMDLSIPESSHDETPAEPENLVMSPVDNEEEQEEKLDQVDQESDEQNPILLESLIPALQEEILPLLKKEVEEQVKKAIVEYCELHFKRLARDVIKEELRSLASD